MLAVLLCQASLQALAGPTARAPRPAATPSSANQPADDGATAAAAATAGNATTPAAPTAGETFANGLVSREGTSLKLSGPEHLSISIDEADAVVDVGAAPRDLYEDGSQKTPENPFVFGPETVKLGDGAEITTSSSHRQWDGEGLPSVLLDGDPKTRWSSDYKDKQTLQIKLKGPVLNSTMKLYWETAAAKDYLISASTDGVQWLFLGERRDQPAGPRVDSMALPDGTRFVRLNLETRTSDWGFSLFEIGFEPTPPPPAPPEAPVAPATDATAAPAPAAPANGDQAGATP